MIFNNLYIYIYTGRRTCVSDTAGTFMLPAMLGTKSQINQQTKDNIPSDSPKRKENIPSKFQVLSLRLLWLPLTSTVSLLPPLICSLFSPLLTLFIFDLIHFVCLLFILFVQG